MYCDNCKSNYPNELSSCPYCRVTDEADLEKYNDRINKKIKEIELNKKVKRANLLVTTILVTFIGYIIIENLLHFKISTYYSTSNKYTPAVISTIILSLVFIWIDFKRNSFTNVMFIIIIGIISIFGTIYISVPMINNMWHGNYLYTEYWMAYGIYNILVILQSIIIMFDDSYYIAYHSKGMNYSIYQKLGAILIMWIVMSFFIEITIIMIN